tara:strand:- start:145 stop:651 length:507 start_codon:yes stop_codon:yes gene_type:complete
MLKNEFQPVRNWAKKRGIFEKGDSKTQYVKLQEEAGELAKAILKNDQEEIIDALGDCFVVLVNLSELCGYKLEECINSAYKIIKDRQGQMNNGTFTKQTIKTLELKIHKNGYYNLPCPLSRLEGFMKTNNIKIGNKIYSNKHSLHLIARDSKTVGGACYIYPKNLPAI